MLGSGGASRALSTVCEKKEHQWLGTCPDSGWSQNRFPDGAVMCCLPSDALGRARGGA